MTRPQSHLAGVPSPTPKRVFITSFPPQVLPENPSFTKSGRVISCSEPSPVPAENPNSPASPASSHPPASACLPKASALSVPSACGVLPCTSHDWLFPLRENFLRRCLLRGWSPQTPPGSRCPPPPPHLTFSWVRKGASLAANSFLQWGSEPGGGCIHPAHCWSPSPVTSTQQVLNTCLLTTTSSSGEAAVLGSWPQ